MAIDLEKMLRPSSELKKTARSIKNPKPNKKPTKVTPKRKKKPPATKKQMDKTLNDMGMKPLGYWAKEMERFIN